MKRAIAGFLVAASFTASCFAAAPVIKPTMPVVYVSSTMQFVADQTVTWSVAFGTGTISAGGLYTAPSSFLAKNQMMGWQLLPNDSIYNTRVDSCPILASSNTYFHNNTTNDHWVAEVDMPSSFVTYQTNLASMTFQYTPENNGMFPMNGISSMSVENGLFAENAVDEHILSVNISTGCFMEMYKYFGYNKDAGAGFPNTNSRSGVMYCNNYTTYHTVDAASLKILPLATRYSEIVACRDYGVPIQHAQRFTLPNGYINNTHKWPANDNSLSGAGELPEGTWIRLKSNVAISTYSATAQCLLNQYRKYGMVLADGGTSMHAQLLADAVGDYTNFTAITSELSTLSSLTANDFEVVDPVVMQSTNTAMANYHTEQVATNTYVVPDNYAIIAASNTTTHQVSYMSVQLRPVTIGVTQPAGYSFLAGAPATQLPVILSGAPNDPTYSCTMSPSTGTLSRGGIYTPPAAVLTRTSTTVTCVSHQDPAVWTKFPLYIYTSTGARVSLSNASENDYGPDVNGNKWYGDMGAMWRLQGHANCDWTGDSGWGGVTDSGLYKHCEYVNNGSGDYFGRYYLANGTYTVNMKFSVGQPDFSRGTWQTEADSQGQVFSSTYTTVFVGTGPWQALGLTLNVADLYDIIGNGHSDTPGQISMTRRATDNTFYYAMRHLAPNNASQPASSLAAVELALVSLDTSISSPTLTLSDTGSGIDETITIISSNSTGGQFKLVFEAADNWGLSQWYDLVNDGNSQTNLALAYSVNGPANMCNRENGLGNLTFYGKDDNKYNIFEASCVYSSQFRSMTIVRNTPTLVILESKGYGMSASPTIDTNTLVTVDYYIYPNGQIYIHDNITVSDPWDFTAGGTQNNYFMEFALNNPGATGSVPPDSGVGWARASYSQNPYDYVSGADRYVFAYWDGSTIGYSTFTKASIMAVPSPNNTSGLAVGQISHNWSCGTGCGTTRWGYSFTSSSSSVLNMSAGASVSWDWMIQLGSQGSQYLPDLSSVSVCDPIATAYINNPTPNVPALQTSVNKSSSSGKVKSKGKVRFK